MEILSYTEARQNLAATMDRVINSRDAIIITRQKSEAVVMMSLEEFNGIQETLHLLSNPANAEHLLRGMAALEADEGIELGLEDL